jgi:exodeoxyribonuclease VII large subunit
MTTRRMRRYQALRDRLEGRDVRRKLGDVRHRLAGVSGMLQTAVTRRYHRADARFKAGVARLESLSPLAVLGRGYAVVWNTDRTAIVRDARSVSLGERVQVTLHRGELECEVKDSSQP